MLKGLGGLGDMAKMMKAAQEMQGKMAEMQEGLERIVVIGESGLRPCKSPRHGQGRTDRAGH